ncbi:MAG: 5-(carboxyamino)imidazole ribonucleotide synthase [Novosphingobium sp.]|uniref:5-(carboxyamino)imidazole ribonucleotide synthase n=1 Tax=Novosphingobium sp. TaxID=1874826 RepID=UPI0032BAFD05
MIPPGEVIGILGGGQLGRMLAMAAQRLGYKVHIYAPENDSVAAEVSQAHTRASWDDASALAAFASACAVVTYEWENVPIAALKGLGETPLFPSVRALEVAQDRLNEKEFVENLGGRTASYMMIDTAEDLDQALIRIGSPGILKTRREGYDGKGQWRIAYDHEAEGISLAGQALIYEGLVRFSSEFSVILARGQDGKCVFWDSAENVHEHGILAKSTVPAGPAVQAQIGDARALAQKVADALGYIGVAAFEFFATDQGAVFNEMAPRVHNSGHWTIEGAATSQFENHIRAICGLPLGETRLAARGVEMRNLIGDDVLDISALAADPANHVHLYGKGVVRPGRKMGHVTRLLA